MLRPQPSPAADKLWAALRKAKDGLTAADASQRQLASEPYARRRLRVWAEAGFLSVEEGIERISPHRYRMMPDAPKQAPAVTANEDVIVKDGAMKPAEFARLRRKAGLSLAEVGRHVGWSGTPNTLTRAMRRFEKGERVIDAILAEKLRTLA